MWTLICLMPAAALLTHQIRKANATPKTRPITMADVPVIVMIGDNIQADLEVEP